MTSERSRSLIGRWKSIDPWQTGVSFEIDKTDGAYSVCAIDGSDGEKAEIYDIKLVGNRLTFAAHWSSGQLTKYTLRPLGGDIEVTFTYTGRSHFQRDAGDKP